MGKILIVDDELEFREKHKKLLTDKGYSVLEAPDALEVANILMREKSELDLVLLDINMPQVDGRGVSEIIEEYAPNLPMVVTSIYPLSEQKFRVPKAADYYQKSHSQDVLLRKVKSLVGSAQKSSEQPQI